MRPLLSEHLTSLRRILAEEVAPALGDDYARQTLDGVVKSMAMLATAVDQVAPFLEWDNAATRLLLSAIAPHVDLHGDLSGVLAASTTSESPEQENERLRAVLASAIGPLVATEGTADVYTQVVAHLRERINRYPHASTASLPTK